jgi:PAS domain S-box-containing protein
MEMNVSDPTPEPPEQTVLEENGPFQLLLETLPYIAFVIWPEGQAAYYNRVFIDYLGFRPGPDKASRTALHHPDDQPVLEAARAAGVATSSDYVIEARVRRHDSVWRWHRIHNKPLLRDGQPIAWLGTAVDIHDFREANEALERRVRERTAELEIANQQLTAEIQQRQETEKVLRDSEARYRMLYNRTPMALHSVDAKTRLIDVNDTWLEMLGYKREDVLGRSPADFMTAESAERYRPKAWPEMLAGLQAVRVVDYQFLTSSGSVVDGRLAASGEFDTEGRFVRSWSAIADVTAEKRADQDLRQAQRLEAVGQLTAGIAHDFNNLLTAVLGSLELLTKRLSDREPRITTLLAGATTAAQRGAALTSQLLAFSRQQRITAEPIDLHEVIEKIKPLLQATIGAAIEIDIVVEPDLWIALGDPTQLELAIMNLAINGRDAMLGAGTITIRVANASRGSPVKPEEPAPGDYVSLSVADTGSGMPDDVQERAFEPFFTTKGPSKGSGLGLSQVLGMTKQLHGGVAISSVCGTGTCVTIFLPRAEVGLFHPGTPATSGMTYPALERNVRVLLVDDDADVRDIAAAMLREAGHDVVEVASAAAALDILTQSTTRAELLLTDVVMPGMNGVDLATIVRRDWPELPVLFMTGYAGSGLLPADANDNVLRKPFQAVELATKVLQAVAQTRTAQRRPNARQV